MSELDRVQANLNTLIKRRLKINAGLEAVEKHPEYSAMIHKFKSAMSEQVHDLLSSDLFKEIDGALGAVKKAQERIDSESDYLEIQDAVANNIKPLITHKVADAFTNFMILIFNLGGQDFLNKQNIPATFELTNGEITTQVKTKSLARIKGLDDTTQKWVTDQISIGRSSGLSNADIADNIRIAIPDTYAARAERIVRTETSNMVGESEHTTATRNGASNKEWVVVDDGGVCPICENNEKAGMIGVDGMFPSGDMFEPAHPNCRCVVEYVFTPFQGTIWHGQ